MRRFFSRAGKQGAAVLLSAALIFSAGSLFAPVFSAAAAETDGASAAAVTASDTEWTSGSYEVTGDVTLGSRVNVSGDVTLILGDGCLLTASKGIGVSAGNSLTITGNGELKATGERYNAGIGGSYPFPDPDSSNGISGAVTIESGTVTAAGGQYAAGIGGGCANNASTDGGIGSNITINGGTVTATGGQYAAGIGSGCYKFNPSYIEGGNYNNGENITITGGTVVAVGGDQGAGIGGGYSGFDFDHGRLGGSYSNITISDNCDVTAVSGKGGGAGIGGGHGGDAYGIVISGGIIKATGEAGAGIGSGSTGDNADITISGGTVEAIGSSGGGAGIGGGNGSGCSVTISGGTVKATGSSFGGAGIGGGEMCKGSIIVTITDGNITAVGGSGTYEAESSGYISRVGAGAGIGGGGMMTDSQYEHTVAVEISGGVVNAAGGSSYGWKDPDTLTGDCAAPGIGFGGAVTENGSVTFSTGDNGSALIIAAGGTNDTGKVPDITNGDNTSGWSGMIFQGNDGLVCGNGYTLAEDFTVPEGATLTISEGATLTVSEGATLTNSGTIINNGAIANNGTLTIASKGGITGSGTVNAGGNDEVFLTQTLTEDLINVPDDLVYNGTDLSEEIKPLISLSPVVIGGMDFRVDENAWELEVTKADDLNYTVTYTHANGDTVNKNVTINPAPIEITGAVLAEKTYDGKTAAEVSSVSFSGIVNGESLAIGTDYTAAAEFTDANAGEGKTATVTVTLGENLTNYTLANGEFTLADQKIEKAENPPVIPGNEMSAAFSRKTVGSVELPEGWEWSAADKDIALEVDKTVTATACYTNPDRDNYINIEVTIKITRSDCEHAQTKTENEKKPTCTESGYTGDTVCAKCGEVITKGTEIEKLPHSYRSEVTTKPTVNNEGVRTYTCENCGDSYTESIPKLNKPTSSGSSGSGRPNRPSSSDRDDPKPGDTSGDPKPGDTPNDPKPGETDKPYIKGDSGKEGWDVIRAEAEITKDGGEITVEMNDTTEVPGDILNSIKDKDITITFDMGDGVSWSVNGTDITSQVGNIDFGVTVGSSGIPVDVINNVTGENYSLQLSLSYDGEFGFTAMLSVDLGAESAGCYASLFYYNETNGELEFISESKITDEGVANLEYTHASDYIVVVNEKSRFDEDGTSDSSEAPDSSEVPDTSETESGSEDTAESEEISPTSSDENSAGSTESSPASGESSPAEENPKTGGDTSYIAIWAAAAGVLAGAMGLFVMTRRKKDRRR